MCIRDRVRAWGREPDTAILRQMVQEETTHRSRIAQIQSLRGLARNARQEARLEELDRLEQVELGRYREMLAAAREQIGEARFDRMRNAMLESTSRERPEQPARGDGPQRPGQQPERPGQPERAPPERGSQPERAQPERAQPERGQPERPAPPERGQTPQQPVRGGN